MPLTSFIFTLRTAVVAKLVIQGISPLTSFIFALRAAVVAKLVIQGVSSLTSFILVLRVVLVPKFVLNIFYLSIIVSLFHDIIFLLHYLVYLNQLE